MEHHENFGDGGFEESQGSLYLTGDYSTKHVQSGYFHFLLCLRGTFEDKKEMIQDVSLI